jgi:hypothetical protein
VLTPWGFAAFVIFFIASLAESNRSPFDLPEAESELIAGHLTEYSGFKYALFFMAEYFGMCALSGMGVTLFLGGWQAPLPFLEIIPSYVWFAVKLLTLLLAFIWIRATFPRLRIDQLTRLAWKFLVPLALINVGTAAFWSLSAGWSGPLQLARWAIAIALVAGPSCSWDERSEAGLDRGPIDMREAWVMSDVRWVMDEVQSRSIPTPARIPRSEVLSPIQHRTPPISHPASPINDPIIDHRS